MKNKVKDPNVPSDMQKMINEAAVAAVRLCMNEQDRKNSNFAFRNTKLLIANYNDLKKHVQHAKDNALDIEDAPDDDIMDTAETMDNDYRTDLLDMEPDIFIDSIRRSRCRTIIMIAHIDTCLKLLAYKATKEGNYDRYRMMKKVYFSGQEFDEVASEFFCSEATARRWVNDMIRQLSVFLFGERGIQAR